MKSICWILILRLIITISIFSISWIIRRLVSKSMSLGSIRINGRLIFLKYCKILLRRKCQWRIPLSRGIFLSPILSISIILSTLILIIIIRIIILIIIIIHNGQQIRSHFYLWIKYVCITSSLWLMILIHS
jgi:hypothetical protein